MNEEEFATVDFVPAIRFYEKKIREQGMAAFLAERKAATAALKESRIARGLSTQVLKMELALRSKNENIHL
jgi:hypothetical protein